MTVPDSLRTPRLLLRPWRPDDAPNLLPVLEANQAHIGPWIPERVAKVVPIPELEVRLATSAADFIADREWRYGLFTPDESLILGEVALFSRDDTRRVPFPHADRAEIGYWLREDMTGQGLATEAAQAMLHLAATLPSFTRVEIRCDSNNLPSAAIPRRLGFVLAPPEHTSIDDGDVWTYSLRD